VYENEHCTYNGMYILEFLKISLKHKDVPKVFWTLPACLLPKYAWKDILDKETFNKVNICTNQNETLMK